MLPARWDETLQEATAQSLDLDPESPMVKMEMISIVRRGMGGFSYSGVPFGYQEVEVGSEVIEPIEFVEEEEPVESVEPIESADNRLSSLVTRVSSDKRRETSDDPEPSLHDVVPPIPESVVPTAKNSEPPGIQQGEVETAPQTSVMAWGLAGLAGCVIAAGIVVFMRSKKV